MNSIQNIKLTSEQTTIFVCPNASEDSSRKLKAKLEKYGIKYIDEYYSNIEGSFEINLKDNIGLPQKKWDKFMGYLYKKKFLFKIASKFI